MKKYISLALLLLTGTLSICAQQLSANCVTNPPDFSKLSYEEANSAIEAEERKSICPSYLTNLVNEIRGGHLSNDNKALAIDLLTELHPDNSYVVEFLIQDIDFERTRFDDPNRLSIQLKYPCEGALMRIGQPVVIPILNHLPNETNQLRRQLMCNVLKEVWRKK